MTERTIPSRILGRVVVALCLAASPMAGFAQSASGDGKAATAPGINRLFDTRQLDDLAEGTALVYVHTREVGRESRVPAIENGALHLAIGASQSEVSLVESGRERRFDPFPRAAGNPVFVVFLESLLRAVATQTGGSPFYLRNRIKEALWRGAAPIPVETTLGAAGITAERLSYQPFASDPHRAELGDLAGLTIAFVLADAAPGRFVSLSAATPDGAAMPFREEIRLTGEAGE